MRRQFGRRPQPVRGARAQQQRLHRAQVGERAVAGTLQHQAFYGFNIFLQQRLEIIDAFRISRLRAMAHAGGGQLAEAILRMRQMVA